MTESVAGFFAGSGKAAKFPTLGSTVSGTIVKVHPPEQVTDFETRQPVPGKSQIRIELETTERDPNIDTDDGVRTLYVKGWMTGAIGDALRKVGQTEPVVGAWLSVTWSSTGAPTRPGLQGPHQYTAEYRTTGIVTTPANGKAAAAPPPAAAPAAPADAPIPTDPPPGIDAAAWANMPVEVKQAIANAAAAGVTK